MHKCMLPHASTHIDTNSNTEQTDKLFTDRCSTEVLFISGLDMRNGYLNTVFKITQDRNRMEKNTNTEQTNNMSFFSSKFGTNCQ